MADAGPPNPEWYTPPPDGTRGPHALHLSRRRAHRPAAHRRPRQAGAGHRQRRRRGHEGGRHGQPRRPAGHLQPGRPERAGRGAAAARKLRRAGDGAHHGPARRGAGAARIAVSRRRRSRSSSATAASPAPTRWPPATRSPRPCAGWGRSTWSSAAGRPSTATPPRWDRRWPRSSACRRSPASAASASIEADGSRRIGDSARRYATDDRRDAFHRGRLRDPALRAAGPAHHHRRGQRAAPAERQARAHVQERGRRGHAAVRRQLPGPGERRGRGVHGRPRRPTCVPRQGRPVGRRRDRRRKRAPSACAALPRGSRTSRAWCWRRPRPGSWSPRPRAWRRSCESWSRSTSLASAAHTGGAAGAGSHAGEIWVWVEVDDGRPAEVSLELLGRARELADRLGVAGGRRGLWVGGGGARPDPRRPRRRHRLRRRPSRPGRLPRAAVCARGHRTRPHARSADRPVRRHHDRPRPGAARRQRAAHRAHRRLHRPAHRRPPHPRA